MTGEGIQPPRQPHKLQKVRRSTPTDPSCERTGFLEWIRQCFSGRSQSDPNNTLPAQLESGEIGTFKVIKRSPSPPRLRAPGPTYGNVTSDVATEPIQLPAVADRERSSPEATRALQPFISRSSPLRHAETAQARETDHVSPPRRQSQPLQVRNPDPRLSDQSVAQSCEAGPVELDSREAASNGHHTVAGSPTMKLGNEQDSISSPRTASSDQPDIRDHSNAKAAGTFYSAIGTRPGDDRLRLPSQAHLTVDQTQRAQHRQENPPRRHLSPGHAEPANSVDQGMQQSKHGQHDTTDAEEPPQATVAEEKSRPASVANSIALGEALAQEEEKYVPYRPEEHEETGRQGKTKPNAVEEYM